MGSTIARIYGLSKVHKLQNKTDKLKLRPIISSIQGRIQHLFYNYSKGHKFNLFHLVNIKKGWAPLTFLTNVKNRRNSYRQLGRVRTVGRVRTAGRVRTFAKYKIFSSITKQHYKPSLSNSSYSVATFSNLPYSLLKKASAESRDQTSHCSIVSEGNFCSLNNDDIYQNVAPLLFHFSYFCLQESCIVTTFQKKEQKINLSNQSRAYISIIMYCHQ